MKNTGMPKNELKTIRRSVKLICTDPSLTQQGYESQTDINKIIERFKKTGELPFTFKEPVYGDVSMLPDYAEALMQVEYAREAFMQLPAELRSKFGNDPQAMLTWVENPANREMAEAMGLLAPKKPKAKSVDGQGTVAPATKQDAGSAQPKAPAEPQTKA